MLERLKRTPTPLDIEINALIEQLSFYRDRPADYKKIVDELDRLHKMKMQNASRRVSPDTLLTSAVNFAGIVMIIRHEQFNVITSKALGFVPKPKA